MTILMFWRRRHERALAIAQSWCVQSDPSLDYDIDEALTLMARALVELRA